MGCIVPAWASAAPAMERRCDARQAECPQFISFTSLPSVSGPDGADSTPVGRLVPSGSVEMGREQIIVAMRRRLSALSPDTRPGPGLRSTPPPPGPRADVSIAGESAISCRLGLSRGESDPGRHRGHMRYVGRLEESGEVFFSTSAGDGTASRLRG